MIKKIRRIRKCKKKKTFLNTFVVVVDNEPIVTFKICRQILKVTSWPLSQITNYNEKTDVLFVSNISKLIKQNCVFLYVLEHADSVC